MINIEHKIYVYQNLSTFSLLDITSSYDIEMVNVNLNDVDVNIFVFLPFLTSCAIVGIQLFNSSIYGRANVEIILFYSNLTEVIEIEPPTG